MFLHKNNQVFLLMTFSELQLFLVNVNIPWVVLQVCLTERSICIQFINICIHCNDWVNWPHCTTTNRKHCLLFTWNRFCSLMIFVYEGKMFRCLTDKFEFWCYTYRNKLFNTLFSIQHFLSPSLSLFFLLLLSYKYIGLLVNFLLFFFLTGGPGQFPHLAPTYAAVNALCVLAVVTEKVFDYLDRCGNCC